MVQFKMQKIGAKCLQEREPKNRLVNQNYVKTTNLTADQSNPE